MSSSSAVGEKRAEDKLKSSHKKEKKAKTLPAETPASPTAHLTTNGAGTDAEALAKAEDKKRRKEEKRAKKRAAEEEAVDAPGASSAVASTSNGEPASKKAKTADAVGEEDAAAAAKAEKKRRKEEKKAKKAGAAPASSSSTTVAASSNVPSSAPTDALAANAFLKDHNITLEAPEESDEKPPLPFLSFKELRGKVDDGICAELDRLKFEKPTPIQACCWPVLLSGKDVVGIAETGSGKTFAFGVPALQYLVTGGSGKTVGAAAGKKGGKKGSGSPQVSVLVVAPTRELAKQTHDNMQLLAPSLGFGSVCLFGGVPKYEQEQELHSSPSVRIVVGTPGRVLDLAREGKLDLSGVAYLVLDEADRMLDKGFEPDIRAIIGMCKSHEEGRHTSMFSATWPPAVRGLADTFMRGPIRVTVGSDELTANKRVEQRVEVLDDNRAKERRLQAFLREIGAGPRGKNATDKVLIFALYKKEASRIEETLRRNGFSVTGIHGDMTQPQRMASLDSFKNGVTPLLVATDVAARGLDIPQVEQVINVTFPLTIEDYVHRIGRTARGGRTGRSMTFFTEEDKAHAGELVKILKDSEMPVPEEMYRFSMTIKKKEHSVYGSFYKEPVAGKAKKITFD